MATQRRAGSYQQEKDSLVARLNRLEGQVRGIRRMIEEERYCVDVLQQLAAVRAATDAVAQLLMESHIRGCVAEGIRSGDGDAHITEVMRALRRYMQS